LYKPPQVQNLKNGLGKGTPPKLGSSLGGNPSIARQLQEGKVSIVGPIEKQARGSSMLGAGGKRSGTGKSRKVTTFRN